MLRVSKCVSFMCWRREVFKFRETSVDMMDIYSVLCTPLTCACSTFKFDLSGSDYRNAISFMPEPNITQPNPINFLPALQRFIIVEKHTGC